LALGSIIIPATNVLSIDDNAFINCCNITSIDVSNVTSIGNNAFDGCTSLTTVDLKSIASIGNQALQNCPTLNSISYTRTVAASADTDLVMVDEGGNVVSNGTYDATSSLGGFLTQF
jgi:hypothetical protein